MCAVAHSKALPECVMPADDEPVMTHRAVPIDAVEKKNAGQASTMLPGALGSTQFQGVSFQTKVPQFARPPFAAAPKLATGMYSAAAHTLLLSSATAE